MTTVACWFNHTNPEEPSIWIAADSKLSTPNGGSLLDSASKVFPLPVNCFSANSEGAFQKMVWTGSLGFAFAGSAIVGMNTYTSLMTCLQNLCVVPIDLPSHVRTAANLSALGLPALEDVARFAAELLRRYSTQAAFTSGPGALCEIAIVGLCPVSKELKMFHVKTIPRNGEITCVTTAYVESSTPDSFVLLLGDSKQRIEKDICELRRRIEATERTAQSILWWWRAPLGNLCREVTAPGSTSIGGYPQLGYGGLHPFRLLSIADAGPDGFKNSYLGLDLAQEYRQLSLGCIFGVNGMMVDDLMGFVNSTDTGNSRHSSWPEPPIPWSAEIYSEGGSFGVRFLDENGVAVVELLPGIRGGIAASAKSDVEKVAVAVLEKLPRPFPFMRRKRAWSYEVFSIEGRAGFRLRNAEDVVIEEVSHLAGLPPSARMTEHGAKIFAECAIQRIRARLPWPNFYYA